MFERAVLNQETWTHVELLVCELCGGSACLYCPSSLSKACKGKHWLSYFISLKTDWLRHVDNPKFVDDRTGAWTYVCVPMRNNFQLRMFLDTQLGKPMNMWGYAMIFLGTQSGCTKTTEAASQQPSWFCSELFAAALRNQGYTRQLDVDPCTVKPADLRALALSIPHAYETHRYPGL